MGILDRLVGLLGGSLADPALDDPEHADAEPELTEEDLAGRLEDSEPLTAHVNLRDDDA